MINLLRKLEFLKSKKILLILLILTFIICAYQLLHVKPDQISFPIKIAGNNPEITSYDTLLRQYANFMKQEFDSTHSVGAAYTIVYNGKVIFIKTLGVKKAGTSDSIDIHSVFRVASVSKGFAGVLACLLERDGVISFDDKVIDYLPDFRLKDSLNTNYLSLKDLLSQTTGLVPHAFDNLVEEGISFPDIMKSLVEVEITAPPGQIYSYQNTIFSLIDTIFHSITGKSYDKLLNKYIFLPLKMHDASAGPVVFSGKKSDVAFPHYWNGHKYLATDPNLGYYNLLPAAGINVSIFDMGKWLVALLGHKPHVLTPEVVQKIVTPVIGTPLQRRYLRQWGHIEEKF